MSEGTPDMAAVLDLLRVRGCNVSEGNAEDSRAWVSFTSLRGHRWAIVEKHKPQQALDFLSLVNKDEL